MKEPVSLNELYTKYRLGNLQKKDFEELIFKYVLHYYRRFPLFDWSEDKCIDYLCGLYPRLSRAVDAYKDVGASFETYILSKVYWTARERRAKEADHHITEYACWKARAEDVNSCEQEPEYLEAPPAAGKPVSNPRQVLILLLKSYFYMSDDLISRIAPSIGIKKEKLTQMVEELRKLRFKQDEKIRDLQERIHCQYYRCITFAKRLEFAAEGSARYERLKNQLERAQKRHVSMKKHYAAISRGATNRQIAEVLGVPKGTVDSNLYAVKQKIKV